MVAYEQAAIDHFQHQKVEAGEQVSTVLPGFQDPLFCKWITNDRIRLQKLTFEQFMAEAHKEFLDLNWEADTRQKMLSMCQGDRPVKLFFCALKTANTTLVNTPSHLSKEHLQEQEEVGLNMALRARVNSQQLDITDPKTWEENVIHADEALQADQVVFQQMAKHTCDANCNKNNVLQDPLRRANSQNNASAPSKESDKKYPPTITSNERFLFNKYNGCTCCREFDVDHHTANCPNGPCSGINYQIRTEAMALAAIATHKATKSKGSSKTVNTVIPKPATQCGRSTRYDFDNSDHNSTCSCSNSHTRTHPVTAVLGSSRNPAAAHVAGRRSSLGSLLSNDGENAAWTPSSVCAVIEVLNNATTVTTHKLEPSAPLHVPI